MRRDRSLTTGIRATTTGVLFMNALRAATGISRRLNAPVSPLALFEKPTGRQFRAAGELQPGDDGKQQPNGNQALIPEIRPPPAGALATDSSRSHSEPTSEMPRQAIASRSLEATRMRQADQQNAGDRKAQPGFPSIHGGVVTIRCCRPPQPGADAGQEKDFGV